MPLVLPLIEPRVLFLPDLSQKLFGGIEVDAIWHKINGLARLTWCTPASIQESNLLLKSVQCTSKKDSVPAAIAVAEQSWIISSCTLTIIFISLDLKDFSFTMLSVFLISPCATNLRANHLLPSSREPRLCRPPSPLSDLRPALSCLPAECTDQPATPRIVSSHLGHWC